MKVEPEAAGMDAARLERITEHFEAELHRTGEDRRLPDHRGARRARGLPPLARADGPGAGTSPWRDDAIFRIFSMTKPIASVALMQLYERGMFQLTDPVHRYIPEWRALQVGEVQPDGSITKVKPNRPMNVRDVLMHTTGLPGGLFPDNPIDEEFAEAREAQKQGHDAGRRHGPPGRAPAEVPPGHPLELRALHRHRRPPGRDPVRGTVRRVPAAARSSSRWAWSTPASSCPKQAADRFAALLPVPAGQHPGPDRDGQRPAATSARAPTSRAPAGWSRPPTTTSPSARCWPTGASSTAGASSVARPLSS